MIRSGIILSFIYILGMIHIPWSGNPVLSWHYSCWMGENMCHGQASGIGYTTNSQFHRIPDNGWMTSSHKNIWFDHGTYGKRSDFFRDIPVGQFMSCVKIQEKEPPFHGTLAEGQPFVQARQTLYTEAFTQRSFYTKNLYTEKFLPTEAFIYTEAFKQRNFYTQKLLHAEAFTDRSFFAKTTLHRGTFTQRNLYAQTRLHTVVFTHRSFRTEKSLPIFHHVSFFMIIHHLSSSYLRFHPLLVNSLCRFVFISHGVLSVHASSWLPLRRSKLNENPGIVSD